MFHISFERLDTVLTYTKYREYNFLNKEIPLFNASTVQIWSLKKKTIKRKKLMKYTKKI